MKTKRLSLFPNLPHRKSAFLFGPGEQILDQIETICSQQDKFGNDTKTFRFRFQNDIGTFVLSFLTLLNYFCRAAINLVTASVIQQTNRGMCTVQRKIFA
jgi:hypothetical protein